MNDHTVQLPPGGSQQRFLGKDSHKMAILVLLILLCVGATYYYHFILGSEVVFSHLFYLPIALAGFWWERRGVWVAVFLAVLLSVSHLLSRLYATYEEGLFRAVMFVAVGLTVGTLREQALRWEKNLRETRDYLDSLIRYANAPIIVWDSQGRITRFNAAFEHFTGYTASEVIGQEFQVLFPEVSRDESSSEIAHTLSGEHWDSVEIPILCQDGERRLALWNSANIYAGDGTTLLATIAQGQDITERKAAKDALAASKAYTESIIQNFLDTLIVVDTQAKIQTVNPATCRLLSYAEEELKGQSVRMLFAEEEEEEEEVKRVFQFFREPEKAKTPHPQDTIRNRELTYKTKDGRLIPMSFNASMLTDEAGHVTGVVAGAKDITDIKQAEEAKRIIEVKFRNVIENIFKFVPEGLLVLTDKLNVFRRNKAFED
ncbi:MAG: PAS domain-containing protein, partial [Chloroflexota bacterium]